MGRNDKTQHAKWGTSTWYYIPQIWNADGQVEAGPAGATANTKPSKKEEEGKILFIYGQNRTLAHPY